MEIRYITQESDELLVEKAKSWTTKEELIEYAEMQYNRGTYLYVGVFIDGECITEYEY